MFPNNREAVWCFPGSKKYFQVSFAYWVKAGVTMLNNNNNYYYCCVVVIIIITTVIIILKLDPSPVSDSRIIHFFFSDFQVPATDLIERSLHTN